MRILEPSTGWSSDRLFLCHYFSSILRQAPAPYLGRELSSGKVANAGCSSYPLQERPTQHLLPTASYPLNPLQERPTLHHTPEDNSRGDPLADRSASSYVSV
jgi:hypothetical protein